MNILNQIAKNHKEWIEVCRGYGAGDYSEDLVQDMYLKIADSKIDSKLNYRGYVFSVLRNLCYDLHRNNNFDISLVDNLTPDNVKTDGRLELLDIHQALENLPYFEKKVVQLNKIDGIGLSEIQRETGACRIKMWKAREKAIIKLRKALDE